MSKLSDPIPVVEKAADDWSKRPYLIIGGTTKAATTSLFNYLGAHPQVCMSSMKETRFFLDRDYPLESKYRLEDGAEKYAEFFQQCPATTRLWVEATPDYLYSRGTPARIRHTLKNVRLVFVLREPKARVVSWYRFARQNNLLPETTTLESYVISQSNVKRQDVAHLDQHLRAVEQGRYAVYLRPYFETFGKESITVVFMEELAWNPKKVMREVCGFARLDLEFYETYEFEVYNRTENLKNPVIHGYYKKARFYLKKRIHNKVIVKSFLRWIRLKIEPIYFRLNRKPESADAVIPKQIATVLNSYYRSPNEELTALLERTLPWNGETQ